AKGRVIVAFVGSYSYLESKRKSHAAVDVAAIERRPRVDGPSAVDAARGPQERIPACLPDVGQILAVDEQQRATHTARRQDTEDAVRPALGPIGVVVEPLRAGVEPFDADVPGAFPVPRSVQSDAVARRQRNVDSTVVGGRFTRPDIGIVRDERK